MELTDAFSYRLFRNRIDAGAKFLDDVYPGWESHVTPALIDIKDLDNCILGQVFGKFNLGALVMLQRRQEDKIHAYGFNCNGPGILLAAGWRYFVRARLKAISMKKVPKLQLTPQVA